MPYYRAAAHADATPSTPPRIGVLIVNFGSPDSPTYFATQRFLKELLGDRRANKTPRLILRPLLYGAILPFRPLFIARKYRKIWTEAGSPLAVYSRRLVDKIALRLQSASGDQVRVALGMTYGNPSLAEAVKDLALQNVKRLLVLPLFPQHASSTTGAVFDRTSRALQRWRWLPETRFVSDYHDDAGYIGALCARIAEHWAQAGERSHLLLSYHGIPAADAHAGDPYLARAEATTRLVVARLGLAAGEWSHCYQSRFGETGWLQPYTEDALKALAKRGLTKLSVSSSFAVDCLETLEEVTIEYRDQFLAQGGARLSLVPALNDQDLHAEALASIVRHHLNEWL
jgi:ferrochelatase